MAKDDYMEICISRPRCTEINHAERRTIAKFEGIPKFAGGQSGSPPLTADACNANGSGEDGVLAR